MIRKSALLVSTGLFAIATPAFAQTASPTTDKQAAQPTPGATQGAATQDQQSVATGDIVITVTRLSPTCRWR